MTTGPDSRRWQVPLDLEALAGIESEVAAFLDASVVDDRAVFVSRLVIEEVARNLVEHTASEGADGLMDIELRIDLDAVTVIIEDSSAPFDPFDAPELDAALPLEDRSTGGMGLHLVRAMTDHLTYEQVGDRNRLTATVART